jgi:hypothetical protein
MGGQKGSRWMAPVDQVKWITPDNWPSQLACKVSPPPPIFGSNAIGARLILDFDLGQATRRVSSKSDQFKDHEGTINADFRRKTISGKSTTFFPEIKMRQ